MLRHIRELSWLEFDNAVNSISDYFHGVNLTGVYGVPRGGLPLAIAISHRLSVPLLNTPQEKALWIDDIVETGVTLRKYLNYNMYYSSWFGPKEIETLYSVNPLNKSEWLVFPWESKSKAKKDMEEYELSRK